MRDPERPRYRVVHKALTKIEPRMARAVQLAAERLRDRIPYRQLESALGRGDVRGAADIINQLDVADAYLPAGEILKETIIKGGKVADQETS